jgi:hypothetical protein
MRDNANRRNLLRCARVILVLCGAAVPLRALASEPVDFSREVLPVLAGKCFACHGPDAEQRAADLRLDQREAATEAAIVPGDSAASELVARITSSNDELRMPPPDAQHQLTDADVALLTRWIDEGAAWGQHWAFEPPQKLTVPDLLDGGHAINPIDNFVLARLAEEGLSPAEPALRRVWLRRVSFDLTGLPPSPEELEAFEQDQSEDAYAKQVDRLLASPHYGERMAADWLDIARYADTNGYQNDFNRSMWPWRDWVIQAFNTNLSADQFLLWQIAGDLLPEPTEEQLIATGFNRNHRMVTEGGSIDEEWRVENVVDRVETTATAFLGLTMGCARCHDHKYDPLSKRDFYSFYAFFNNVDEQGVYTERRGNVPPMIQLPTPEQSQRRADLEEQLADVRRQLEAAEEAPDVPKPTAEGEEAAPSEQADQPAPAPPIEARPAAREQLQQQLDELTKAQADLAASIQTTMIMRDRGEVRPTYILRRGQYDQPDTAEHLHPQIPAVFGSLGGEQPANRLGLARWLIDPGNPLTARVLVNRLWQQMFGRGLVATADNFGVQGDSPSHPELLDWLAVEFVESGWDTKAMLRQIALSATYRQSATSSTELRERDPSNRLLARGPRRRLSAEMIRDNALSAAGLRSEKMGGPAVKPYQPDGLWDELAGGANGGPYVLSEGEDLYRRSLYTFRKRTVSHPTLATFDAPSWEICQAKRGTTNTPLQSLALLNDTTYVEAAAHLAMRMQEAAPEDVARGIAEGFLLATSRRPLEAEGVALLSGYDDYLAYYSENPGDASVLLTHGGSPVAEERRTPELAALAAVAAVILNLDETLSR